jgi:hypothetical protein
MVLNVPERGRLEVRGKDSFAFGFNVISIGRRRAAEIASDLLIGLRRMGRQEHRSPKDALAGNYSVRDAKDLVAAKSWREREAKNHTISPPRTPRAPRQ